MHGERNFVWNLKGSFEIPRNISYHTLNDVILYELQILKTLLGV